MLRFKTDNAIQVLDDNRELFIPETQQLVKAHSQFLLFGTQNPPGSYGGRKVCKHSRVEIAWSFGNGKV